ncbi:type II toxin-antitoxin system VapC family toxin [Thermoactinospora rubra]|uniref:type II toxin-antitoxin system VapC family toxin n=1 Tax=Thermoactinospora rubra TaxID=1088767 RepID=UPI000A0F6347|nr:type II toxin-antitoxin system VapC family toxin [Thermoactinospora rubra]
MLLPDTNVLVNAFRRDAEEHARCREIVTEMVTGDRAYAVSDFALNGFVRLVTNPRVYRNPDPLEAALKFAATVRNQRHAVVVHATERHWGIFTRLCREVNAKGNLVPDAYLAALAIEHGCEFVTLDKDFARFEGLRWRHPLN